MRRIAVSLVVLASLLGSVTEASAHGAAGAAWVDQQVWAVYEGEDVSLSVWGRMHHDGGAATPADASGAQDGEACAWIYRPSTGYYEQGCGGALVTVDPTTSIGTLTASLPGLDGEITVAMRFVGAGATTSGTGSSGPPDPYFTSYSYREADAAGSILTTGYEWTGTADGWLYHQTWTAGVLDTGV